MNNWLLILFLIFSNFWIYKIFQFNFLIGFVLTIFSILLIINKSFKYKSLVLGFLFFILIFFQFQTTKIENFQDIQPYEKIVQENRFKQYPTNILGLNIPLGYWVEMKAESYFISGYFDEAFENLDLNQYFFGSYPRQRVGVEEFEKFPYSYLLLLILGILVIFQNKELRLKTAILFSPIILIPIFSNQNILGPFILFPFFIFIFWNGCKVLLKLKKSKLIILSFIVITLLILLQQFIYQKVL